MKYSVKELIKSRRPVEFTFFYGGTFSQWKRCSFVEDGVKFNCAEQYMMYHKAKLFGDNGIAKQILESTNPKEQKQLGRLVSNFDANIWNEHKYEIVKRGNTLKFSQNPSMKKELMSTRTSILVEASPYDRVWGIGIGELDNRRFNPSNWRGENLLGFALTEVREMFKNN